MKWINKGDVPELVQLVRSRMGKGHATQQAPVSASASVAEDPYEKLRKLAELRDQGVITPEDFEAKKAALLESI